MKTAILIVISTGWLLPLYLGVRAYLQWLTLEIWPRVQGKVPANSFPFASFCGQMMALSLAWLAVALAVWVIIFVRHR